VSRLNDADVARLLAGLGGHPPVEHDAPTMPPLATDPETVPEQMTAPHQQGAPDEIAQLRARVSAAVHGTPMRGALEAALFHYLRREVSCSISDDAPSLAEPLRFEGGEPLEWHLDITGSLAAALGDLVIGGDGANVRHVNRRRLGRLVEPLATRIAAVVADAAEAEPVLLRFIETARRAATPLAGGTIEVGAAAGGWSVGAALRAPRTLAPASRVNAVAAATGVAPLIADIALSRSTPNIQERPLPRPEPVLEPASTPARDVVHPVMDPVSAPGDARQQGSAPVRDRVIGPKPADLDGAFAGAVAAACSRLGEIARCETAADAIIVTRVETPSLSRDDLKVALIAGGQGSLVLSADREAVTNVAAATVGAHAPSGGKPGAVVVDAVEAVLRAALRGFAENLPGIAGGPQRFVRLAEGALPARSPHYAIAAPLRIGERAATLQWLVPTWMATAKGEERAPSDGR
jgi:hypothetical protein